MQSIVKIFKTGVGPSSSHTMGPEKAAQIYKAEHADAKSFKVVLYGSLASTGRGHGTDKVLREVFSPLPVDIEFCHDKSIALPHENTLDFFTADSGVLSNKMRVMSVGGGDIRIEGRSEDKDAEIYPENTFSEIAEYCTAKNLRLSDYVKLREGDKITVYLREIWNRMKSCILDGLSTDGILPGGLNVERKARFLYNQRHMDESQSTYENRMVCAYAFAVSEQNAAQGRIVTAPTCGSCGVIPAVFKYMQDEKGFSDEQIVNALCVAGLIGNIVKTNASISGAECGCQAEIGTACSMAAGGLAELFGMGISQIEYAAEVALEHHLGLTCDPICGLVQIPCIERNAVAAMRVINALTLANFLTFTRKISFDLIVKTMYETGKDMSVHYRETSEAGLAKLYK